jgi:stage V sporulation protein SpoVS
MSIGGSTMQDDIFSQDQMLRVARTSPPGALAGAISKQIRRNGYSVVQAMGASATNQMVKAMVIARSYLKEEGIDLVCTVECIPLADQGDLYLPESGEEEEVILAIRMEIRPVPISVVSGVEHMVYA